jgi:hypothetical protein
MSFAPAVNMLPGTLNVSELPSVFQNPIYTEKARFFIKPSLFYIIRPLSGISVHFWILFAPFLAFVLQKSA